MVLSNVCDALTIFILFGTKLYNQVAGIAMCTYFAPLLEDVFLFVYERALGCLFLMKSRMILLTLLTQHPDIWMIFKINKIII